MTEDAEFRPFDLTGDIAEAMRFVGFVPASEAMAEALKRPSSFGATVLAAGHVSYAMTTRGVVVAVVIQGLTYYVAEAAS